MSVITCDEIIGVGKKAIPTNFNEQNIIYKTQNFKFFTCLFINYHCSIGSC